MSDSRSVFVLVVDDTPENLLSVSVLLQAPGRTIVTAVSGEVSSLKAYNTATSTDMGRDNAIV